MFSSLQDISISLNEAGEKILAARLRQHLRPVSLEDGKLEVQIDGDVKQENFLGDLARFMSQKSGQPWLVSQAAQGGGQQLPGRLRRGRSHSQRHHEHRRQNLDAGYLIHRRQRGRMLHFLRGYEGPPHHRRAFPKPGHQGRPRM